jgi:hypothetical protein
MKIRYTVEIETEFYGEYADEEEPSSPILPLRVLTQLQQLRQNAIIAAGEEAVYQALKAKEETTGLEHKLDHGMHVRVVSVGGGYRVLQ